jgi:hypothetical protein
MNDSSTLTEMEARCRIADRVAHAAAPRLPAEPTRHRLARRLRRMADRIDN